MTVNGQTGVVGAIVTSLASKPGFPRRLDMNMACKNVSEQLSDTHGMVAFNAMDLIMTFRYVKTPLVSIAQLHTVAKTQQEYLLEKTAMARIGV